MQIVNMIDKIIIFNNLNLVMTNIPNIFRITIQMEIFKIKLYKISNGNKIRVIL
jgi:hypothetical protein